MQRKILFFLTLICTLDQAQAIARLKFRHWYPKYREHWKTSASQCAPQLSAYYINNRTHCSTPCSCAADCLLRNVTGTMQSNFASAQVLLGLIPAIFAFAGPSIAEVAALSTFRPLLAVLLAAGSPAVNVTRLFRQVDVREPFEAEESPLAKACAKWLATRRLGVRRAMEALSYVGAVGAIANSVWVSVDVDMRTISGWRCGALLMPLVWSLLGVVVHGYGMVALRVQVRRGKQLAPSLSAALSSRVCEDVADAREASAVSQTLLWLASFCAIVHMVFGVFELSSLVFISALEALQVFGQYAASVAVCQFVLQLQLANMRYRIANRTSTELVVSLASCETMGARSVRAYTI